MSLNAGSVYALLGARVDMSGFAKYDAAMKRSVAQAGAAETAIAGSGKRSSAAMMALGTAAKTGAAVGIAAVGKAAIVSIKEAANFQQAMADVQAVTKASAGDMKRLSGAALDLGAKTGVGATKAAGALAELAKGGLSTKQTIGALAGTIAMSQAGGLELADAANTVAQALNLFALKGEDASHVADAFATAANKTTADVGFFAQGLAQGGAAAKAAGLNFDQTTAALEIMAANGFKSGSDAGTSLKTALIQLAHPSKKAADVTKELGLNFFKSNGEMKSLTGISTMLRDKMGGLTRQQRLAAASTLVGTDGMRALLALYDQGPRKIRQFEDGLRAQGTAQDVANAKMDNLKGSWQKFTAQLQTMAIKVGTAMLPTLQGITDQVTRFFDSLNKGDIRATGFGRFAQSLASAVSPVIGVLKTLASAAASTFGLLAKVPGPQQGMFKAWAAEARGVAASLGAVKSGLDNVANMKPKPVKLRAEADVSKALATLRGMEGTKLGDKVVQVVASDGSAREKIRALIALGIPPKQARVIVLGAEAAQGKIASVRDLMSTLSDKTVTLTTIIRKINQGGSSGFRSSPPKNASGRGPGAHGAALVGEGGGPEFYGNPQDGWAMAAGPQIVGLGASDYVIPTEDRYRGRALALMADALGIPGFKKGKKAKKRPKPIHVAPIQYAEYLSPLEAEVTKWQDRVNRDQGLKDDKVQDGKRKGKLTKKAQEARRKLPGERAKLQQAKRELKSAKEYGARIEKQEELANIYADDMGLATTDAAWSAARGKRMTALDAEARLLTAALKLAGGPTATSKWARALRKKLGEAQLDKRDAQGAEMDVSTFTDAQQARLDDIDAALAVAELTDTRADDVAALTDREQFLAPLLGAAQSAGRSTAVTEIAGLLKQTRDSLAEAQKPIGAADISADQQLTTDQAFKRGLAQGQSATINRTVDSAFGGPAVVINTLHPGSPEVARALGDAAAAGFGYQRPKAAPTVRVGV